MKIGLSRSDSRFEIYESWLEHYDIEYEVLDHKSEEDDLTKFDKCSGLILTGGVDIYPEIYCDWDTVETRGTYMPERDGFELNLIEIAVKKKLPILAICRGCQLMNVYFRGSLIFDLMEIREVNHDRISKTEGRFHNINIYRDTLLHEIVKLDSTEVNSYHHQAIDRVGEGLMINAKSGDGVIEGIEYSDKEGKPFLLGIQWHPERFANLEDRASENVLKYFINECKKIS